MRPRTEHIENARLWSLGATGVACLVYALLAIWQNRPDPLMWWLPVGIGVFAAAVIFMVAFAAGPRRMAAASDELYLATARKAAAQAYWFALPLFFCLMFATWYGGVSPSTAMASFGVLLGGAFPILFVFHSLRPS